MGCFTKLLPPLHLNQASYTEGNITPETNLGSLSQHLKLTLNSCTTTTTTSETHTLDVISSFPVPYHPAPQPSKPPTQLHPHHPILRYQPLPFKMSSTSLSTPPKCTADFCLIPLGTPTASVSAQIADVQRLMKKSGVKYSMHSAGTTLEGTWDEVTRLIGQAHTLLHDQGIVRIQTDIRIGSRTDKAQSMTDKVDTVNKLLAKDDA